MSEGNADKTRVLLAEDVEIVREGLKALLEPLEGVSIVGEAADGQEALESVEALRPDAIFMDLAMPKMDGVEATRRIKEKRPEVRIVALTSHNEEEMIYKALRAGADGYLLKDVSPKEIQNALETVMKGGTYFTPSVSLQVIQGYLEGYNENSKSTLDALSKREKEVLGLMARGNSHKEIAEALFISPKTVESHRDNLLRKLEVRTTAELIVLAARGGLV